MKWNLCLGVALLLVLLLAPTAGAGDELRLMGLYRGASGDGAVMMTVNMHGHVTRYDLSGVEIDPADPTAAWATRNQVFSATQQAGYLGNTSDRTLNELNRLAPQIQPRELADRGPGAESAGELWYYAVQYPQGADIQYIPLSASGSRVAEHTNIMAQKLCLILDYWMPASEYLGDSAPTPFRLWPVAFSYTYGGFGGQWDYQLEREGDALRFTARGSNGVDLDVDRLIHPAIMGQAQAIIAKYGMDAWDGFNQRDDSVLDGNSFSLSYGRWSADHPSCEASGYMLYPDGYDAAHAALVKFFDRILASL